MIITAIELLEVAELIEGSSMRVQLVIEADLELSEEEIEAIKQSRLEVNPLTFSSGVYISGIVGGAGLIGLQISGQAFKPKLEIYGVSGN